MKKMLALILCVCMLLGCVPQSMGSVAVAEDAANPPVVEQRAVSGDFTYTDDGDGTATITGYTGTKKELVIPSEIDGLQVTAIGDSSFYDCGYLRSITIPEGVTSIGSYAFYSCSYLSSITIPNSVTSIGDDAFSSCISLTSITIPEGVTSIGYDAFSSCISLTSITIPNSVTSIGSYAFSGCSSLTSITIPEGVTSIDGMFSGCESLSSITIPYSVTRISSWTFKDCDIQKLVATVYKDTHAHTWCVKQGIDVVVLPYEEPASTCAYTDNGDGTATITGYTGYTASLVIPSEIDGLQVTAIGDSSFYDCDYLSSITIPEGVTSIGNHAFYNCGYLSSITIPESVASIGNNAFCFCDSLTSITIAEGVTNIGDWAFGNCSSLTSITLPNSVTNIGDYAFYNCESLISITIPEGITSIGNYAFYSCYSLTSITIPESVASIGNYAFNCCYSLTSITIPENVTSIGSWAFKDCDSLTSIIIPEGVISIGYSAFCYCDNLTSITLPISAMSIDYYVFGYDTTQIPVVTVYEGTYAHIWCMNQGIDMVVLPYEGPAGAYTYTDNDDGTATITGYTIMCMEMVIPSEIDGLQVTAIGVGAFQDCESLTSITIPEGVTSIGSSAFSYCTSLTSITIPEGVTSIGDCTFSHCSSLTSIAIPEGVTSIGDDAFASCGSLTSITIPESVTSIGISVFSGCSSLSSITIPEGVTSIGNWAFYGCNSLTSITIPGSVRSINNYAFEDCDTQKLVATVYEGTYAHAWCVDNGINVELLPEPASAYTYTDNGDGTATVIGYTGNATALIIPSEIDGLQVTAIGEEAFYCNSSIFSIAIPEGVKTIGNRAFMNCSSVTEVSIPASVTEIGNDALGAMSALERFIVDEDNTVYQAIDGMLLSKDGTELMIVPITFSGTVTIPEGVQNIWTVAVRDFSDRISEIVLPDGITTIEWHAIISGSLKKINLPASLTSINDEAFYNVSDDLVATVYEGTYAHAWCVDNGINVEVLPYEEPASNYTYTDNGDGTATITGYTGMKATLVIPSEIDGLQVTAIGEEAFSNNETITSVVIPEGVTTIGRWAFDSCTNLTSVELPETLTTIQDYAFHFCLNLEEMTIPAATTEIGAAFSSMPTIITVATGNSAYKMVDDVLYTADGKTLKYVPNGKSGVFSIPEGTENIGEMAFFDCYNITEIRIPASVTVIVRGTFGLTTSLERFVVDAANTAFQAVDGMLLSKDGTVLITVPMTFSGKVTIPDGVQTIWSDALRSTPYSGITEIVLPDGIQVIEHEAILNMPLQKINLPASLTSINDYAFYNVSDDLVATVYEGTYAHAWCVKQGIDVDVLPYEEPASNYTYTDNGDGTATITGYTGIKAALVIPSEIDGLTVVAIEAWAFSNNETITSVVIPEGVTTIGNSAFLSCTNLTSVELPETLTTIQDYAFCFCFNLKEMTIPAATTEIGAAFCSMPTTITVASGNSAYKVVDDVLYTADGKTLKFVHNGKSGVFTIPEGTETIGESAFFGCYNITEIRIPASVTVIVRDTFGETGSLERFVVDAANTAFQAVDGMLLSKDGTVLITVPMTFSGKVTIPDGVQIIWSGALRNTPYSGITEIVLPDGIQVIESSAIPNVQLQKINLPASLTSINDYAFYNVGDDLVATVYEGTYAHAWCVKQGIDVEVLPYEEPASDYTYTDNGDGTATITGYAGTETELVIPSEIDGLTVTAIGASAFDSYSSLTSITIPDSVTSIGNYAFSDCSSLTSITIPEGVTSIGSSVFSGCSSLTSITIPEDVTNIGNYAFYNCFNLTSITIPEGVTNIGNYAFYDCFSLTSITLPDSVTSIGNSAFSDCTSLTTITLPDNITHIGESAFMTSQTLYVNSGTVTEQTLTDAGIAFVTISLIRPFAADRIDPNDIPCGMVAEVEIVDGLFHVTIDNEATDWDSVYSLQEPMNWYNPDTGESGYAVERIVMGAIMNKPEGAAYCKGVVGNIWSTDEEIMQWIDQATEVSDLNQMTNYWALDIAYFDEENGRVTLEEYTADPNPWLCAIQWLDEDGEELFVEKLVYQFEYTKPELTHTFSRKLIDETSIVGNAGNAAGVTCEITDGSIVYTQTDADAVYTTHIKAPENSVSYSLHQQFYDSWVTKQSVENGVAVFEHNDTLTDTSTFSRLICWFDADGQMIGGGWITITRQLGELELIRPFAADRIDPNDIPCGMVAEVEIVDGLFHVTIDNEATDWDSVYSLQEPMNWYNPDTGESGYAVERIVMGAIMNKPEGAAYCKGVVGNIWSTDEEIMQWIDQATEVSDLNQMTNYWALDIAYFDEENGRVTLEEYTADPNPWLCAIQWLDEDGEELFVEKLVYQFEYTKPELTHTFSRKLIDETSIVGNAGNAAGVTCEITDGSIVYTQTDADAVYTTHIKAPENSVSYSLHQQFYDSWVTKQSVENGVAVFEHNDTLTDTSTFSRLICWFDADGQMIGGGWITITRQLGEELTVFLLPESMQEIWEEAFCGSAVQSVVIPDGCTIIGSRAFADCAQLRQIVIPASVTSIAADAFSGCTDVIVIAPEGSAAQTLAESTEGLTWQAE